MPRAISHQRARRAGTNGRATAGTGATDMDRVILRTSIGQTLHDHPRARCQRGDAAFRIGVESNAAPAVGTAEEERLHFDPSLVPDADTAVVIDRDAHVLHARRIE